MLIEKRRVYLKQLCPRCGGKLFRILFAGTAETDEQGCVSHVVQVCDFCEKGDHPAVAWTGFSQKYATEGDLTCLFEEWVRGNLTAAQFAEMIGNQFRGDNGGWVIAPTLPKNSSGEREDDEPRYTARDA